MDSEAPVLRNDSIVTQARFNQFSRVYIEWIKVRRLGHKAVVGVEKIHVAVPATLALWISCAREPERCQRVCRPIK